MMVAIYGKKLSFRNINKYSIKNKNFNFLTN